MSDSDKVSPTDPRLSGWLFICLFMMGSLVAVTGLRQFFFDPIANSGVNVTWFVVQLTPLLVPLPGLLRGGLISTFILCMAALLYFIHGVMIAFDPSLRIIAGFEIVFALGLCTVTAIMVRKLREIRGT